MLALQCLEVDVKAVTPLALDPYCGSAIRGAFFRSFWKRFCVNQEAKACSECSLVSACPVASLMAPLREEASHGRDISRPYIITPPVVHNLYEPGEIFSFGMTLIGSERKLVPYVLRTFQEMEREGIGRPLAQLRGKRGHFSIHQVRAYHPFTGEKQIVYEPGVSLHPKKPTIVVKDEDIQQRAAQFSADQITVHFQTPTRLIVDSHLLRKPNFCVLALRLAHRFAQLYEEYQEVDVEMMEQKKYVFNREWYKNIEAMSQFIQVNQDDTTWVESKGYSNRQGRQLPRGGFVGKVIFVGDIRELRELLAWGELLHVGKNAVKGDGIYQIL